MNRRQFMASAAGAGAAAALTGGAQAQPQAGGTNMEGRKGKQPNIVFICADQLGAKALGCYGSGVDSTPNLDRLAQEGVRFGRYYASCPVCAPNRATMLTGRSPWVHGVITNNYALETDNPTYAHVLRAHGYRTGGFGKFHQTPMAWPPPTRLDFLGFDEAVVSEDPKWGPYIDWVKRNHPEHYATALAMTNGHGGHQGLNPGQDRMQGASEEQIALKAQTYPEVMRPRIEEASWSRAYPSPLPPEVHDTTFITECGLDFIKRREGQEAPYFCHVSYVDPHDPYDPPEPYASMFDPDDMPDALPAEWEEQGPQILRANQESYLNYAEIADDPAAIRRFRALFHGSLRYMDDQIGRIIDHLKASGQWENTIVVFSTDHGEMMGDHGCIAKALPHYDAGIRCPLIVGGGPVGQADSDRLSCTLDLFPTFCQWAGVHEDALPPLEGTSFAGACTPQGDAEGWNAVSISISTINTIVTEGGWRMTQYGPDQGQLFNLREDPDELNNLYWDPAQRDRRSALLEQLTAIQARMRVVPRYANFSLRGEAKIDTASRLIRYPHYGAPPSPWLAEGPLPDWQGEA